MKNLLVILAFLFGLQTFAQINKSDSIVVENNTNYIIHQIQKGQTLFSLSKLYEASFKEIKEANPTFLDNLSIGDYVKIPTTKKPVITPVATPKVSAIDTISNSKYLHHEVQKGETIYGLTKKYNVTKEELYELNPELADDGLKLGNTVLIKKLPEASTTKPITPKVAVTQPKTEVLSDSVKQLMNALKVQQVGSSELKPIDTIKQKRVNTTSSFPNNLNTLNIVPKNDTSFFYLGVMLPFHFEKNKQHIANQKEDGGDITLMRDAKIAIEFYQGLTLAIDSLKKEGLRIKVYVYDTKADTGVIRQIFKKKEIEKLDLIIGPVYTSTFVMAAKLAMPFNITVVSPFAKNESVVVGLNNAIRMRTDIKANANAMADYVADNYAKQNIIIAYEVNNMKLAEAVKQRMINRVAKKDTNNSLKITLSEGVYQPLNELKSGEKNIIMVLNDEESYSTRLAAKLYTKRNQFKMTVFGMEEWKDFKNIEINYWDSLHIHVAGYLGIDYGYNNYPNITSTYFNKYNSDFNMYSMSGFDAGFILLKNCIQTLNFDPKFILNKSYVGLLNDYYFTKGKGNNGCVNEASNIYQYKSYKFFKVD